MPEEDRVVVAECRGELQADVLIAQLRERGIDARVRARGAADLLGGRRILVHVATGDLSEAKAVVATLRGTNRMAGLLDVRRLVPAVAALGLLILLITVVIDLVI